MAIVRNDLSSPAEVVEWIFERFAELGGREYGESVTELQHALQCAALAERKGEDPEIVIACLLHDFGHLVHGMAEDIAEHGIDGRHEDAGYEALRRYFPASIVDPGRLHVAAKRYLCATREGYLEALSEASLKSLYLQGGPMSTDEVEQFEAEPYFREAIVLREYDDLGKDPQMQTPPLEHYRELLEGFVFFQGR